jgi:hypothetical protein
LKKKFSRYRKTFAYYLLIGSLILYNNMSYSQVNIIINKQNIATTADLWNVELNASFNGQQVLEAAVTVYDENELVLYKGATPTFVLQPTQNFSLAAMSGNIIDEQINFDLPDSTQELPDNFVPNGNYVICVSVFTPEPKVEINRACELIEVKNTIADSLLQLAKKRIPKPGFSFGGTIETFTYFDVFNNNNENQLVHRNTGVVVSPAVTVFNYPLNMVLYYDTDSDFYYNNVPTFQFNFDTQAFQQTLQTRLEQAVANKSGLSPERYTEALDMVTSLNELESITSNPYFLEEVKRLDSLKVYEQYLNDSSILDAAKTQLESISAEELEAIANDSLCTDSLEIAAQYQHTKDSLIAIQDSISSKIAAVQLEVEKAKRYAAIIQDKSTLEATIMADSNVAEVKKYYDQFNNFDAATLQDPSLITNKLSEIDQIKKVEKFVTGFKYLQFGATVPSYSELSISGVLLNGLHTNYAIGNFNVIAVAGKINDNSTFFKPDRTQNTFSKLYLFGGEHTWNEHLSYGLYVLQSDFNDLDSLSFYNFLEKNNTISSKVKTALFKHLITVEGEFAISYAQNSDLNTFEDIAEEENTSAFWVGQAIGQKDYLSDGTFTDKAGIVTVSSALFKGKSVVSMSSRYVGSGFYTPGNPFLLNDMFTLELGIDQTLLKNKLSLSAHVIKNQDNLDNEKAFTTAFYNMRGGIKINIPKYPFVTIDYLPNVIINEFDQIQVNTLSATTGYAYRIGKIPAMASLNYMEVRSISALNDTSNFNSVYYSAINNITFKDFTVQTGFNYNNAQAADSIIHFSVYSLGTRYSFKEWMQVYINFQLTGYGNQTYEPGGQLEMDFAPYSGLSIKSGLYIYPESTALYMTNIQNIASTTIYISATYNF